MWIAEAVIYCVLASTGEILCERAEASPLPGVERTEHATELGCQRQILYDATQAAAEQHEIIVSFTPICRRGAEA